MYVVRNTRTGIILPATVNGLDYEDALDIHYRMGCANVPTIVEVKES